MSIDVQPRRRFRIQKGLDLVIGGRPEPRIDDGRAVSSVAWIADDHPGVRPTALVEVGDRVRLGQPLVQVRARPELRFTSPGAGRVSEVVRKKGRAPRAIVIEVDGDEESERAPVPRAALAGLRPAEAVEALLATGLWSALRERPFERIADPRTRPRALFVTAMDTNPLAPRTDVVLAGKEQDFLDGLEVLAHLTDGPVFVCKHADEAIPSSGSPRVEVAEFAGPHPAGLPGTHMHLLDPVGRGRTSWHVGAQDVAAIGRSFTTGRLPVERIVALAGPRVAKPRLVRTRLGANVDDLVRGELLPGACRVVSGSLLSGRQASGWGRHLGRHHVQLSVVAEDERQRAPRRHVLDRLRQAFVRSGERAPTTELHGRPGPLLPLALHERVMPLDLPLAPLLRALLVGDSEQAEALGCLELVEEDLALCTYVCPSKIEYGAWLRRVLDELEEPA